MNQLKKNVIEYHENCICSIDTHAEILLSNPNITERDSNEINTLRSKFITEIKQIERFNLEYLHKINHKIKNLIYVDYLLKIAFKDKFCFFIPNDPYRAHIFKTNRFGVLVILNQYIDKEIIQYIIDLTNRNICLFDLNHLVNDFEDQLKVIVIYELLFSKSNESLIDLSNIEENHLSRLDLNCLECNLEPEVFDWIDTILNMKMLESFTFGFERIDYFDTELFSKFKYLKNLRFSSGCLNLIQDYSFSGLDSLTNLTFEIELDKIEPKAFAGLNKLEKMEFYHTGTSDIKNFKLIDLPNLEKLFIVSHNLEMIQSNSFHLKNLKVLKLNMNKLTRIESNAFIGLDNLEELFLNDQKVELIIDNFAFSGLKNLKCLYLQKNQIQNLPDDSLRDLDQLNYLCLKENSLISIDFDLINRLKNLQYLDLSKNYDLNLNYDKLTFKSLKFLAVNSKKMPRISTNTLQGLEVSDLDSLDVIKQDELEYISLTFNECDSILETLNKEHFMYLTKLKFLKFKFKSAHKNSFHELEKFKNMFLNLIRTDRSPIIYFEKEEINNLATIANTTSLTTITNPTNNNNNNNKELWINVQVSDLKRETDFFEKILDVSEICRKAILSTRN